MTCNINPTTPLGELTAKMLADWDANFLGDYEYEHDADDALDLLDRNIEPDHSVYFREVVDRGELEEFLYLYSFGYDEDLKDSIHDLESLDPDIRESACYFALEEYTRCLLHRERSIDSTHKRRFIVKINKNNIEITAIDPSC